MRFFALATALISVVSAAPATLDAREVVVADTFAWPAVGESASRVQLSYSYKVTGQSDGTYLVGFYNTVAANSGWVFEYTISAGGDGNDGTSVSKTLNPQTSASFTVNKSGTEATVIIDRKA